jgi:hypothetical protein
MTPEGMEKRLRAPVGTTVLHDVTVASEYAPGAGPAIAEPVSDVAGIHTSQNKVVEYSSRPADAEVVMTMPHPNEGTGKIVKVWEKAWSSSFPRFATWAVGANGNTNSYDNDRFHITAADLDPASFPKLGELLATPFRYAVALHGESSCPQQELRVGGTIPITFRQGVAEQLALALNDSTLRIPYGDTGCFSGMGEGNYVNQLGLNGWGMHVEIDVQKLLNYTARQTTVGTTIAQVFHCLFEAPDASGGTSFDSGGATAFTAGLCPSFVAETSVPRLAQGYAVSAAPTTCVPGDKAHVDVYQRIAATGQWERLAGGTIEYLADGAGACVAKYGVDGYPYIAALDKVGKGTSGSADPRLVVRARGGGADRPVAVSLTPNP